MDGYITEQQLERKLDTPVELPVTKLGPGDWLILATVLLQVPMSLELRFVQLNLVELVVDPLAAVTESGTGSTSPVTTSAKSRGLVYAAIFQNFDPSKDPSGETPQGSTVDTTSASEVGVATRDTTTLLTLTPVASTSYSLVLVNNTLNATVKASVSGVLRVNLDV